MVTRGSHWSVILGDLAEDALVGARRVRGEGRAGNLFIPPTHPGETPSSNEIGGGDGRTATKRDWPRGSRSLGRSVLGGSGANGVRSKGREREREGGRELLPVSRRTGALQ